MHTLFQAIFRRRMRPFADVPGPPPSFPFGNAFRFLRGGWPWEVSCECAETYGPVTLVWFAGQPALLLNDPDLIGQVLESDWQNYYKDAPCKALRPVITAGSLFITNPGNGWRAARDSNPLSQIETTGWLQQQVEPVSRVLLDRLQQWLARPHSRPVDLYDEMQRLAFSGFSQAFWGQQFPEDRFEWFQTLARTGDRRMQSVLPLLPPWNPWFLRARHRWYTTFTDCVQRARTQPDPAAVDLLNVTLRAGTSLSDTALAEALATNFFGGVFSVSSTINTALYLLARHPEEAERLQAALPAADAISWQTLEDCERLDAVMRETMRFWPAVPIYFRNSSPQHRVRLGHLDLPPNTLLLISNWYLHRKSEHWQDPEVFRPERWINGAAAANPLGSGYFFPFGRGPRTCIGQPFALFFIKLALATILTRTRVDLDATQPYRQSFFFGVMMPKGLVARFQSASASDIKC